jgi:hypothetical protein
VLLARLDLVRIRVVPPPLLLAVVLCLMVFSGLCVGRWIGPRFHPQPSPLASPTSPQPQQEGRRSP